MRVKLDKVCKRIYAGGDVPKDRYSTVKTAEYAIPIYANAEKDNGLYGYTDTARENELSITVAARGTIGFTAIRREPFLPVVRLITVVPDLSTVSERYLYYALRNCKPASSGTSIPQLTVPDIKKNEIELYSLSVQETIADKLDAVGGVIELRQQQLQKLDELVKARFVELFGDPVSNPKDWNVEPLGKRCGIITGNTPPRSEPENYGKYIEWIKSDNINTPFTFITKAQECLSEAGFEKCRFVEAGSILMTCIAGSIDCIGNVAVTDRRVAFNQQINAIVPEQDEVLYLYWLMQLSKPMIHRTINMALKGILSKSQLSEIVFPFPPITLQEQFVAFVEQTDKSKVVVQKALDEAQTLFDSLMQEYFG